MNERVRETEVREYLFEDDGSIPNNPTLPLLVYPQALDSSKQDSSRCKELLAENGWGGAWVDGVFSYHHYHSNAHEALCVVGGSASIAFGGPEGETVKVEAGDESRGDAQLRRAPGVRRGTGTAAPENLLRLSVGLEHPDDLTEDLARALGPAKR